MRILHVWDQAGVACILAKYQRRQGYSSSVLRVNDRDKYGINKFYSDLIIFCSEQDFIQRSLREADSAELIHVHSRIDVIAPLREKYGKSKKIFLHYHGTDIRGFSPPTVHQKHSRLASILPTSKSILKKLIRRKSRNIVRNRNAQLASDGILVSTPDLLKLVKRASYLPNPVDIEHFKPDDKRLDKGKRALTIRSEVTDIEWALEFCKRNNVDLDIETHDRTQNPVMYQDMPIFLKRYNTYVDIRLVNGKILENLSKSALESLACGLEVLNYRLHYLRGLPSEHDPSAVLSKLSKIYFQ
jgi:glycosyltransferase involved in cell wall biosynthesis